MTEKEIAKALGQEYSQMFKEIEEGLWNFEAGHPGNPFEFTLLGLRGATKIFSTVLLDWIWFSSQDKTQKECEELATYAGEQIRKLVMETTGVDTRELSK